MLDRHGNDLKVVDVDSLMGCFALALTGRNNERERREMRRRLLERLRAIVFYGAGDTLVARDTDGLVKDALSVSRGIVEDGPIRNSNTPVSRDRAYSPSQSSGEYTAHPSIRALANRAHLRNPLHFPRSAQAAHEAGLLRPECERFIIEHSERPHYIEDKFVFGYLVSDIYSVAVNFWDEARLVVSENSNRYEVYIRHCNGHFDLLVPERRIVRERRRVVSSTYTLEGFGFFTPPEPYGFHVHTLEVDIANAQQVQKVQSSVALSFYVFANDSVIAKGREGEALFFLSIGKWRLKAVAEKVLEKAEQALVFETEHHL